MSVPGMDGVLRHSSGGKELNRPIIIQFSEARGLGTDLGNVTACFLGMGKSGWWPKNYFFESLNTWLL